MDQQGLVCFGFCVILLGLTEKSFIEIIYSMFLSFFSP